MNSSTVAAFLLPCMAVSCVSQVERMKRPDGSEYFYAYHQLAGAGTGSASSGTTAAFDGQKSFQDFLTMVGVSVAAWSQAAIAKAKEISARYTAGQITKREAQAQMAALQQAELAAKTGVTTKAMDMGSVPAVNAISPP